MEMVSQEGSNDDCYFGHEILDLEFDIIRINEIILTNGFQNSIKQTLISIIFLLEILIKFKLLRFLVEFKICQMSTQSLLCGQFSNGWLIIILSTNSCKSIITEISLIIINILDEHIHS